MDLSVKRVPSLGGRACPGPGSGSPPDKRDSRAKGGAQTAIFDPLISDCR
jgi:hypothetical protein